MIEFKKPSRPVSRVFLHCSASDATGPNFEGEGLVCTIDHWHKQRWRSGLGYHFLIDKPGRLMKGRDLKFNPVAQAGHNRGTIAICCHGLAKEKFTEAQQMTLYRLCAEINRAYGGHVSFHGHKQVAAKACPVFDYREWLGLDAYGNFKGSGLIEQTPGLLSEGDNGPDVKRLQQRLNITDDGIFGPATKRAVTAFQRGHGLTPDGIVGPKTRKALEI